VDAEQQTLRLPDGYAIEPANDRHERKHLLLKRADGSAVAVFEFSALGPDPRRIWQIAWDDVEADLDTR
jgi:hypothetical protein